VTFRSRDGVPEEVPRKTMRMSWGMLASVQSILRHLFRRNQNRRGYRGRFAGPIIVVVVTADDRRPPTRDREFVRSQTPAEAGLYGLVPPDGGRCVREIHIAPL
jgi:hypothetical protein